MIAESELKADLGITKLQARRIKKYLEDGGGLNDFECREFKGDGFAHTAHGLFESTCSSKVQTLRMNMG
jgi:hypothetical protein